MLSLTPLPLSLPSSSTCPSACSDNLLTTDYSTFGYVAAGLSGTRPHSMNIVVYLEGDYRNNSRPVCQTISSEPCYHSFPAKALTVRISFFKHLPYCVTISRCMYPSIVAVVALPGSLGNTPSKTKSLTVRTAFFPFLCLPAKEGRKQVLTVRIALLPFLPDQNSHRKGSYFRTSMVQ